MKSFESRKGATGGEKEILREIERKRVMKPCDVNIDMGALPLRKRTRERWGVGINKNKV